MARLKELGSVGATLLLLSGCGTLLGLDGYDIDDTTAGDGDGDTGDGDGDTGDGDGDTGDGDGDTGDGDGDGAGGQGTGGMPVSCGDTECDDKNDCTRDSCVDDQCAFTTLEAGEACDGGVCNGISGNASCVRCIDDASGLRKDSGCDNSSPLCDQSGTPTCVECLTHTDCDDDNDCTTDTCDSGTCEYEEETVGSSCPGGVCGGSEGDVSCVRCIDDARGDNQDTGCPAGAPRCEDDDGLVCVGCNDDSDCDNSNECRSETCNSSAQCVPTTESAGVSCMDGVCNGAPNAEECVACINDATGGNQDSGCTLAEPVCDTSGDNLCRICVDDGNVSAVDTGCTGEMPVCDPASDYSCVVCADDRGPGNQDSGCSISDPFCVSGSCVECESSGDCGVGTPVCDSSGTCVECAGDMDCGGDTPYCSGSGTCVECRNASHCGDEVNCTDDACNAGTCQHTANDANCPDSGDACNPNVCDATSGCEQSAIAPTQVELVQNGNFALGDLNWEEYSRRDYVLINDPFPLTPQTGSEAAWLCGIDDELSDIYQWITIPPDTTEFTVSGYYYIQFQNDFNPTSQSDADDYFIGRFYDLNDDPLGSTSDRYIDLDGSMETSDWVYFEKTYTNVSTFLPGQQIQFDFLCETNQKPGDTAFYVDNVSVLATVCQP